MLAFIIERALRNKKTKLTKKPFHSHAVKWSSGEVMESRRGGEEPQHSPTNEIGNYQGLVLAPTPVPLPLPGFVLHNCSEDYNTVDEILFITKEFVVICKKTEGWIIDC